MADHECDFPDTCPVCLGPRREQAATAVASWTMTARYPGHCRGCNLAIHEGQRIVQTNRGYVHVGCE